MITVYKIRNKVTGLFSSGGQYNPIFNNSGKTWSKAGHVKNHIRQHTGNRWHQAHPDINNWEVVEIAIQESELKCTPAAEFAAGKKK